MKFNRLFNFQTKGNTLKYNILIILNIKIYFYEYRIFTKT